MFKHLKLSSLNLLLGGTLILLGCILTSGLYVMRNQVEEIDQSWQTYIADRSDKARLESSLRAAIGYGGMIHNIKNYILRADNNQMTQIHSQIAVALSILNQYTALPLSQGELIAINDITQVLKAYDYSLQQTQVMHQSGLTPLAIDQAVMVNDTLALRGLQVLSQGVQCMEDAHSCQLSKGRNIAQIRAATGYGGMIHHFKNYILRQDKTYLNKTQDSLSIAFLAIEEYEFKTLNNAEEMALQDIKTVLHLYETKLQHITAAIGSGQSPAQIDAFVIIDDTPALRGLKILDREVATATEKDISTMTLLFQQVSFLSRTLTFGLAAIIIIFVIFLMWLYSRQIIQPIMKMEKTMHDLADDKLDTIIDGLSLDNELGNMNRALKIFQKNALIRTESQQQLALANENMELQLRDIHKLQEQSDQQIKNAINLASNMDQARITAEAAIVRAERDEKRVSSILDTVTDGILTIDSNGIIESFNPGAEIMFGYRQGELLGKQIFFILSQTDDNPAHASLTNILLADGSLHEITLEHIGLRKNKSHFPIQFTLNKMTVLNEVKFTCVIHDLTEWKKAEEKIRHLALTDPLTGLANRNQFNKKFKEIMSASKRFDYKVALLMLDLDKFKPVNDTYGHPVGDELLIQVANLLNTVGRDIDLVARLGGDEFAIILNGIQEPSAAAQVAQRILTALDTPFIIQSHSLQIGVSIGISLYPTDADNQTDLVRYADLALYQAKENSNKYCFYHPGLQREH